MINVLTLIITQRGISHSAQVSLGHLIMSHGDPLVGSHSVQLNWSAQ
jgi:hypothetical protein